MKTRLFFRQNRLQAAFTLALIFLALFAAEVEALSKNYYGLTTVVYGNGINPGSDTTWSGTVSAITSNPRYYLDQIGTTVWTTYQTCAGKIIWITVSHNPHLWTNNYYYWDVGWNAKVDCGAGVLREGYNGAQYWWQDGALNGDGGPHLVITNI